MVILGGEYQDREKYRVIEFKSPSDKRTESMNEIELYVKKIANNIKINYYLCNKLLKNQVDEGLDSGLIGEINKSLEMFNLTSIQGNEALLQSSISSIKNNLTDGLSGAIALDQNFYKRQKQLIENPINNIRDEITRKQENGARLPVLLFKEDCDCMMSMYLIILTAIEISNSISEEKIKSISEEELNFRLSDGTTAKQLLISLFSYSDDIEKDKYLRGKFIDKLFETVASERLKYINKESVVRYFFIEEEDRYIKALDKKMKILYRDLRKLIELCLKKS